MDRKGDVDKDNEIVLLLQRIKDNIKRVKAEELEKERILKAEIHAKLIEVERIREQGVIPPVEAPADRECISVDTSTKENEREIVKGINCHIEKQDEEILEKNGVDLFGKDRDTESDEIVYLGNCREDSGEWKLNDVEERTFKSVVLPENMFLSNKETSEKDVSLENSEVMSHDTVSRKRPTSLNPNLGTNKDSIIIGQSSEPDNNINKKLPQLEADISSLHLNDNNERQITQDAVNREERRQGAWTDSTANKENRYFVEGEYKPTNENESLEKDRCTFDDDDKDEETTPKAANTCTNYNNNEDKTTCQCRQIQEHKTPVCLHVFDSVLDSGLLTTSEETNVKQPQLSEQVERVKLNVGGRLFETTTATLKAEGCLVLKRAECGKGSELFVDRDGKFFGVVLNFLRYSRQGYQMPFEVLPSDRRSLLMIILEARYYGMQRLAMVCEEKLGAIIKFGFKS